LWELVKNPYIVASNDVLHWKTTARPFIEPVNGWDNGMHYKASIWGKETYKMWYSAMTIFGKWRTLYLPVVKIGGNLVPIRDLHKQSCVLRKEDGYGIIR
jgi:hypothetical protein